MSDIGNYNIQPTEPVDTTSAYPAQMPKASRFPNRGWYTLRTAESFSPESFTPNKAGTALTFQIDPIVVGPTNEGYQLKFSSGRISAKTYSRTSKDGATRTVSQLSDFLKAAGYQGVVPGDAQSQANLVESMAGKPFEALLDWRAYNPDTKAEIKGMENFPSDGAGGNLPYVLSDTQTDDQGNPKRIWANLEIVRFSVR